MNNLKQTTRLLLTLGMLGLLVSACSPKSTSSSLMEQLGGDNPRIFSDRPINQDQFIALIKLKTPALLENARQENGVTVVDPAQLQKITQEQDKTIADLKSLSADVKVLFRYRLVLNAVAVVAPKSLSDKLKAEMNVAYVEKEASFARPKPMNVSAAGAGTNGDITTENSAKFIGADKTGATGKGMRVGVIDTGIDYTHKMFGGVGTAAAYLAVDPSKANPGFPTAKVVGGIDLVGTAYDSSAGDYSLHIPLPDENPLDEAGHGSHVSGTIAGHGDGVNTYDGVAPDASLYAIKVFGKNGSTGDAVVVAALEYAANPARNADLKDRLDVVNLSLGSSFGQPHILYQEAIHNLSAGGTVVVASAGNEGNVDEIVGSPSVADDAISVAASIDDSAWNWKFPGVKFQMPTLGDQLIEVVEGATSKPLAQTGAFQGSLVDLGTLEQDVTPAQAAAVKGQVAFVARGAVSFSQKIKRAQDAGAIAVVVYNNQDGDAFTMGGTNDDNFTIPAFMVTQEMGLKIKDEMEKGAVKISYQPSQQVLKPQLIDTITSFSSKGPRSNDGLLKPEISAPGYNVISAAMGKGDEGVQMSGTSMAGPHITGVMTLLKQLHPELSSVELKSLLMGHAKTMVDEDKNVYLLSRQGAGRVQADLSAKGLLVSDVVDFSLGELSVQSRTQVQKTFNLKNISTQNLKLHLAMAPTQGLALAQEQDVTLAPHQSKKLSVTFLLDSVGLPEEANELDGMLLLTQNGQEVHRIPVLAVVKKVSQILATASPNAVTLNNKGIIAGDALVFNLLGQDARKQDPSNDKYRTKACDLEAVGYRILTKEGDTKRKTLQFAVKIYDPLSVWNTCEISVLFDADGDGVADQELAGTTLGNVAGFSDSTNSYVGASMLLDAAKAREIRGAYEKAVANPNPDQPASLDYTPALVPQSMSMLTAYGHSSVAIVGVDVSLVKPAADGLLHFKVATIEDENGAVESDDFLGDGQGVTLTISPNEEAQPFYGMPEKTTLAPTQSVSLPLKRGSSLGSVMVLLPQNLNTAESGGKDEQMRNLQLPEAKAN